MSAKDWFGVIVRTVGLVFFILSLYYGLSTVYMLIAPSSRYDSALVYGLYGLGNLILSLYLLRGAPALLRWSYPEERKREIDLPVVP